MYIEETECCALAQLAGVLNEDNAQDIVQEVNEMVSRDHYEKCLFAVTTPDEKILEKTLASIGFKKTFLFPRVEQKGMLTLWVALVSDIKLKPKAVKRKAAKRKPRKTR